MSGEETPAEPAPARPVPPGRAWRLWMDYRLRWKRRRYLWRAFRKRRQLSVVADRTAAIAPNAILCAATVRNEMQRLPHFLAHHRALGVDHFLFVDNGSDDGTRDYLAAQEDVSLWETRHSYRLSRFGVDWLTWLQVKHAHGHWCLTLDADEIFIYPHYETRPLRALTEWLDREGEAALGAMMLDMYPDGPLDGAEYAPGDDPMRLLAWFDGGNYTIRRQKRMENLWIQGGVRARHFFAGTPRRAPTLNKVPLVRWNRRYAYVNSTHALLPRRLNHVYDSEGGEKLCGILLHTKFLPGIGARSREEQRRREHFNQAEAFDPYYEALAEGPVLRCAHSSRYRGWRQLEAMGLMSRGRWL